VADVSKEHVAGCRLERIHQLSGQVHLPGTAKGVHSVDALG